MKILELESNKVFLPSVHRLSSDYIENGLPKEFDKRGPDFALEIEVDLLVSMIEYESTRNIVSKRILSTALSSDDAAEELAYKGWLHKIEAQFAFFNRLLKRSDLQRIDILGYAERQRTLCDLKVNEYAYFICGVADFSDNVLGYHASQSINRLDEMGFTRRHNFPVDLNRRYKEAQIALRDLDRLSDVEGKSRPIAIEIPLRKISLPDFQIK